MTDCRIDLPEDFELDTFWFLIENGSQNVARNWNTATEAFESRLYDRWSEPLERFQAYIALNLELVDWYLESESALSRSAKGRALVLLHGRACEVAMQIRKLLESGFPDGATARWRTLHEISVTARLIASNDEETAERYLDYQVIKHYYDAETYQDHHQKLGFEPFSEEELERIEERKDEIIEKHGESIDDNGYGNGWLNHLGIHGMKNKEEEVELEFLHPFYDLANSRIHAGPKGAFMRLGHGDFPDDDRVSFGPSNSGFTVPGQLTMLSLSYVTSALLAQNLTLSRIFAIRLLDIYSGIIARRFKHTQDRITSDERRIRYNRLTNSE